MDQSPSFSITIPNLNGSQYLKQCLPSLLTSISKTTDSKFEIILIDNGSTDDSIDIFSKILNPSDRLKTRIILHPKNIGVARAFAQGLERSEYDWAVIANNDITIEPDWFPLIIRNIQKYHDVRVFCGTVLNHDGSKVESQGLKFDYRGKCRNIGNNKKFHKPNTINRKPQLVWGTSAAIAVYHRDTVLKAGNFDSDFFAYEEDVDLALRLHNLKYKTLYIPSAISNHLGGATSAKMGNFRHRMDAKNWFFIIIKNYSRKEIITNFFPIIEERLRNLSFLLKNTPLSLIPWSITHTYMNVIKKIPIMIRKRKAIKKLIKSAR